MSHQLVPFRMKLALPVAIGLSVLVVAGEALADVPGRVGVRGPVPNPGTQEQELANITFPAPYNVFEFVVTCAACHGGTIDQQVGHFGNWSGSSMASAARDPVYRANQIIVNERIKAATGQDGAGNGCMRCHSPNGWYSGRFDPTLNGAADGSQMIHTVLLSTDDEGVNCESCHRTMGAVTYKRLDLSPTDPAWNMMKGVADWPHAGGPFVDQDGTSTLVSGNPYGNGMLQLADGMTYLGRYPGTVNLSFADGPWQPWPTTTYSGQTYGLYPPGWIDQLGNALGGQPAKAPDGSYLVQFETPIGPPTNPDGFPNYGAQAMSLEHPTAIHPNSPPSPGFLQTSEFCAACHEVTKPVLNHGMPEQRTYSEWKYSAYGREGPDKRTCQSCHMPRLTHEYSDDAPVTLNADPIVSGWFPYAKPRTNTAVHKLVGANRDLPMMMKALYPEVDVEVLGLGGAGVAGAGTGADTRIFPGMLSNRDPMWDRNQRNTEVAIKDAVTVQIVSGPTLDAATGKWEVKVRVVNNTGHRIPSGYPDGRRLFIGLRVTDSAGALVYESGHYDAATATLHNDGSSDGFRRALGPVIDGAQNAVMIYERVTGTCAFDAAGAVTGCTPSNDQLNEFILFDNRIPPYGHSYADYRLSGVKFWNYDPATFVPYEDEGRFPTATGSDLVTYRFSVKSGVTPTAARAEARWQTHTREFMEHLRAADTSTLRPEGPPRPWDANYPLEPNYLSEEFNLAAVVQQMRADGWLGSGESLRDNWGGIAYAAWYMTGKGEPYLAAADDTAVARAPDAPPGVQVYPQWDPVTNAPIGGVIDPFTGLLQPYTQQITWSPVAGADGYVLWIKYGAGLTTASWDKLAIVPQPANLTRPLSLVNTALNVGKTYVYKVQAFNGKGLSAESVAVAARTSWDVPLEPLNLVATAIAGDHVDLSWFDQADNETGFIVERQDVLPGGTTPFVEIARFPTPTPGPNGGGVSWSDMPGALGAVAGYQAPQPAQTYNYQVRAYNQFGPSVPSLPATTTTPGSPGAPANLSATATSGRRVDLAWVDNAGNELGFTLQRALDATFLTGLVTVTLPASTVAYADVTVTPRTQYFYRVASYNAAGTSIWSNTAPAITPDAPPLAPSSLVATPSPIAPAPPTVSLTWTDNANDETGFTVVRSTDAGFTAGVLTWTVPATYGPTVTIVDSGVKPTTTYYYRVRAFRTSSGPSAWSDTASAITPGELPQAPSQLAAKTSRTSATLTWRDNSTNEAGFHVERSTNGGTFTLIGQTKAGVTSFKDDGVSRNLTYAYRVRAFNVHGTSAYSDALTVFVR